MTDTVVNRRELLLGDEAVALAAIHAGISGAFAYPGTPSTEIFEYVSRQKPPGVSAVWSVNEKVAYEEALGMSYAGRRALVSMKHVGLNVAADPFVNSGVTGVNGGLVLAVADDPGMHSSQNEQDSRFYARFAMIPCLEPANQQQAYDLVRQAFDLSEQLRLPVMVRLVTRLAHSRSAVVPSEPVAQNRLRPDESPNWVLLPSIARAGFKRLVDKQPDIAAAIADLGVIERKGPREGRLGVIAAGIARNYLLECFPDETDLPPSLLVTGYPIPEAALEGFLESVTEVLVLEDGYPVIEDMLRGYPIRGRIKSHGRMDGWVPRTGELSPELVAGALSRSGRQVPGPTGPLAPRPPALCAGCPHADMFESMNSVLRSVKNGRVFADIGCYTLGALPPYRSIHSCVDMGASISMAVGAARAGLDPAVAVIGDSTFIHSGMTGLMDAANENTPVTVVILDNATVGMTGGQPTAATGEVLHRVVLGLGVPPEHVRTVNPVPKEHESIETVLREEMAHKGVSVVIASRVCIQEVKRLAREKKRAKEDE